MEITLNIPEWLMAILVVIGALSISSSIIKSVLAIMKIKEEKRHLKED